MATKEKTTMNLRTFKRAILGLALAAGLPLATLQAPFAHAASYTLITATWKGGVLAVNGGFFTAGGIADIYVYDNTYPGHPGLDKPVRTAVAVGQPCTGQQFCFGAYIHASLYTLNPPACKPNGLNLGARYDVIAVDEATQAVSNIATVQAACGTGLGLPAPAAPPSPALSGSLKGGTISASGSSLTAAGAADITLYRDGQPLSTVHTTATGPCQTTICLIPGAVTASFSTGSSTCDGHRYALVALDESTHRLSSEVGLSNICPPQLQ
jgi:hypothetical protein